MKKNAYKTAIRQKIYEGELQGNNRGFAFLIREKGEDLFVPHRSLNGAQHGDTVKARIVKGDEAEIIKIVKRGITTLTGRIEKNKRGVYVIPDNDNYYTDIILSQKSTNKISNNTKVLVDIVDYDKSGRPIGKIVEVLGQRGENKTEILSILFNNGFSDRFTKKLKYEVSLINEDNNYSKRVDYRDKLTITIDGEDAKDFDDAISIDKTADGYTLYVHIADVAHYVEEGGIIDQEAYKRGTSVYFPNMVFPMLPEKLSNNLCSLRPNEEKLTMSAIIDFDKVGNVLASKIVESVIKSNERMTYTSVQRIIDGDKATSKKYAHLVYMLSDCKALADLLNEKRALRGGIDFATTETKIILEEDKIVSIEPVEYKESNGIIEEFMIAANEAVAETLEKCGFPCIYRVHEPPEEDKIKALETYASSLGLLTDKKLLRAGDIADFIKKSQTTEYAKLISDVAVRTMQKAEYSTDNVGHFGLASKCYCHFTSPIRRYPDLIVHRMLKLLIKKANEEKVLQAKLRNIKTAAHCSQTERAAERAEREVIDYYKAVYMQEHIGETFDGVISGVTNFAVFVLLNNGIEGMIPEDSLPRDSYYFDANRYLLKGERRTFSLGDKLTVIVKDSNIYSRRIKLELAKQYS